MKALTPNGYDVIMASEMLGHIAPTAVDQKQQSNSTTAEWITHIFPRVYYQKLA